jgi:hypothetical protein
MYNKPVLKKQKQKTRKSIEETDEEEIKSSFNIRTHETAVERGGGMRRYIPQTREFIDWR